MVAGTRGHDLHVLDDVGCVVPLAESTADRALARRALHPRLLQRRRRSPPPTAWSSSRPGGAGSAPGRGRPLRAGAGTCRRTPSDSLLLETAWSWMSTLCTPPSRMSDEPIWPAATAPPTPPTVTSTAAPPMTAPARLCSNVVNRMLIPLLETRRPRWNPRSAVLHDTSSASAAGRRDLRRHCVPRWPLVRRHVPTPTVGKGEDSAPPAPGGGDSRGCPNPVVRACTQGFVPTVEPTRQALARGRPTRPRRPRPSTEAGPLMHPLSRSRATTICAALALAADSAPRRCCPRPPARRSPPCPPRRRASPRRRGRSRPC